MANVIEIEDLWKEYRLGVISHGTLARDIQSWWAKVRGKEDPNSQIISSNKRVAPQDMNSRVWALKNINLEIKKGEVLGIVGKNGAGKSTLLKILSRVTAPTRGQIRVKGRIASLLEVGTGFHPELTGSENIFMNGAILGMSKKEIQEKRDEIIEFSGVEQYIDTPVKRYSSGMRVRLAFAVAAHLDPEILVIDEVLAVGDVEFQKKCLGRMSQVGKEGRTVLFVSHNLSAVNRICNNGVVISNGEIVFRGTSEETVSYYLKENLEDFGETSSAQNKGCATYEPDHSKILQFLRVSLENNVNCHDVFDFHDTIFLGLQFELREKLQGAYAFFNIKDMFDNVVFASADNDHQNSPLGELGPGTHSYKIPLPEKLLKPGDYVLSVSLTQENKLDGPFDKKDSVLRFSVIDNNSLRAQNKKYRKRAIIAPEIKWELE